MRLLNPCCPCEGPLACSPATTILYLSAPVVLLRSRTLLGTLMKPPVQVHELLLVVSTVQNL